MFKWSKWDTRDRMHALEVMETYIMENRPRWECQDYWHKEGCAVGHSQEETEEIRRTIAEDDTLFANALFAFYIAVTTDTSWLDGISKISN